MDGIDDKVIYVNTHFALMSSEFHMYWAKERDLSIEIKHLIAIPVFSEDFQQTCSFLI